MNKHKYIKEIEKIAAKISELERKVLNEPMDGDDVDFCIKKIKAALNFNEGNLTKQEYDKKMTQLIKKTNWLSD